MSSASIEGIRRKRHFYAIVTPDFDETREEIIELQIKKASYTVQSQGIELK